ncbi:MAG: hypothetical protein H6655_12650 [Ardenticatenaceae bacterium]|nr:hypothetical protein [Ardenticatenaceae bacterium]
MDKSALDSLTRGLACAALEPGLRRVLLFDADFLVLETAVSHLSQMLHLTTGERVHTLSLPGTAQDSDLWGQHVPDPTGTNDSTRLSSLTVVWQEGWLTQNRQNEDWLLVVIHDLSLLSLPVVRTCITLMDSPVAHLQRHGQDSRWTPHICWLAACPTDAVGKVSPHLLDRFSLRLAPSSAPSKRKPETILSWLNSDKAEFPDFIGNGLSLDTWHEPLTQANSLPELSPEAGHRIVSHIESQNHPGLRRELALAHIGRAMARLAGEKTIYPRHIDEAAKLIGLTMPIPPPKPEPEPEPTHPEPPKTPDPEPPVSTPDPASYETPSPPTPSEPILPDEEEIMPPSSLPPVSPYPEDTAAIDREQFSLQIPLRRRTAHTAERGVIVGVQSTNTMQDLALVPTILEAATFQKIRHKNNPAQATSFILSIADLRRYRRIPPPEIMLLLLLDYTSFQDCDWQPALIPHLRWAYMKRATITVIQVGSNRAKEELRAEKVTARSLLTPRIAETLESQSGRATPLAHGLEMAYQTIQQAQQHGRAIIQHTRLVILTDGRGNVPLKASLSGQLKKPVNREGIEDALQVAAQFRGMKRLETILLDPQPPYMAELPLTLAETIGGEHAPIPLLEEARI